MTMHGFDRQELLELAWEKPILAQLEITNKCNQKCIFCYAGYKSRETTKQLSLDQWKIITSKLQNLGVRRLDFTGRESFMHPDFIELISWCKKLGFEIRINTNGTHDVSEILSSVDEIVFSVHGLHSVHDKIVVYPGSFGLIEKNFKRATTAGVKVSINMSLVKDNYHQLLAVFTYFDSKYGLHKFSPSIPVPSRLGSNFSKVALNLTNKLLADYLIELKKITVNKLKLKHGFHSIFINDREWYKNTGLLLPNCAAGKYKLIVESDGRVFPCSFFKSEDFCCGNILTEDEHQIWQKGKGFERFRQLIIKEMIPDQCQTCLKKPRCFSGCRAWSSEYQKGGFEYAKDRRCDMGSAYIRN